jgi:hypothetical protein
LQLVGFCPFLHRLHFSFFCVHNRKTKRKSSLWSLHSQSIEKLSVSHNVLPLSFSLLHKKLNVYMCVPSVFSHFQSQPAAAVSDSVFPIIIAKLAAFLDVNLAIEETLAITLLSYIFLSLPMWKSLHTQTFNFITRNFWCNFHQVLVGGGC